MVGRIVFGAVIAAVAFGSRLAAAAESGGPGSQIGTPEHRACPDVSAARRNQPPSSARL